jgi:uncharacterized SAM-binding protein YcdF (DUF218 family)
MYRAKILFERKGYEVIPYKVDYKARRNSTTTLIDFLPSTANIELTETGIRELIGRLFYLLKN